MRRLLVPLVISVFLLGMQPSSLSTATCVGDDPCNACKNCKYCKYCAKDGGTCGVCKKKPEVTKPL